MARQPDLRKIARRQRWVVWLTLIAVGGSCPPVQFTLVFELGVGVFAIVQISLLLIVLVGVMALMSASGVHPFYIALSALLLLVPYVNLIVLFAANRVATQILRETGLHIGIFGVDLQRLEWKLNTDLCDNCGYNLTGNTSGICPECGYAKRDR